MVNFFNLLFQDSILLITSLILVTTIVVLLWALKAWNNLGLLDEISPYDDESEPPSVNESSGVKEARLQEIVNQLTEINQRICGLENNISQKPTSDDTLQLKPMSNIEKAISNMEAKLNSMNTSKASQSNDELLKKMEAKLEGIHRLLILLSDSSSSSNDQK